MEIGSSSTTQQNTRQGNDDQVSVDIPALALSLTNQLEQIRPLSTEHSIYRVPRALRVLNENAFTPQCVSIGPYHHGKEELKAMEEHKRSYLKRLLKFTQVEIDEFLLCVEANVPRLRDSYEEKFDFSLKAFVEMMLVDAAFVIMVMMRHHFPRFRNEDELLWNNPRMIHDIRNDMMLLENQLPFFILDHLLVLSDMVDGVSMVQIASHFLLPDVFTPWVVNPSEDSKFSGCKHLVDFFRIVQHPLELKGEALPGVNLPSAVELHRAGVKFNRGSSTKLVDINFHNGILEIPLLTLSSSTEILFRNLQAFEQSYPSDQRYFNSYILMLNLLVENENDVEVLTRGGIVQDRLRGNGKVVDLLHNLCRENLLNTENFYFADVVNELNKYRSKRMSRWRATLLLEFCNNPWVAISVFGVVIIFMFTLLQTFFSFWPIRSDF